VATGLKCSERGDDTEGEGEDTSKPGGRSTKKSRRDRNPRVSEEGENKG
jgi:hypothetical protein